MVASMELREALLQIAEIRQQMARVEDFSRLSFCSCGDDLPAPNKLIHLNQEKSDRIWL